MHTAWVILEVNKENVLVVLRPSSSSLFSSHHPPRAAFFPSRSPQSSYDAKRPLWWREGWNIKEYQTCFNSFS